MNTSYGQILKSTTLVGGSQVINIILGIVRTKFLAILLGPSGVGLIGIYNSITTLISSVSGMGISSSGVRQISEAAASGNELLIAKTVISLRKMALLTGLAGMIITIGFAVPISKVTFGDASRAKEIALLSVILLFGAISGGQIALIQGLRKIRDLAMFNIIGALTGTIFSVPMVYLWRESGIIPFLITVSSMTMLFSWRYSRRFIFSDIYMPWKEAIIQARQLIGLGFVFMSSGLMATTVDYLIRVIILRQIGIEGLGLYQAAFTLSSLYIGVILNAMAMDFYPRLTGVSKDNMLCNRMVNEQTEIGLLLATPGILFTLVLAQYIIQLFYSERFMPAYEILRWQILGVFFRVISWPLGFLLMAKGLGKTFFWTELLSHSIHLGLVWLCIFLFGLEGTGIAFFLLYVFYTMLMLAVAKRVSEFKWTLTIFKNLITALASIILIFMLQYLKDNSIYIILGISISLLSCGYCFCALYRLLNLNYKFSGFLKRIKYFLGLSNIP
jgi:PST family polysaccharide transporter